MLGHTDADRLRRGLGTGLRLAEIVGLNAGDVYFPDGMPRGRMRLRREIAKGGRAGDVFLPDALIPKPECFYRSFIQS
jgi:integrase